ncbi:MAG: diacylglycerol kinase family protein [Vicinamibacterales bacterium]
MVSIIINPVSGGAAPAVARQRAELASTLVEAHGEPGEVLVTQRRGHAVALAAGAVRRGARLVVSWGGDGTMNEVAGSLVGTDTALGLVPSGSGNGLARELGVVRDARTALAAALSARPRRIDAGMLDGRYFFSVAGIGFDAHVAAAFDRDAGTSRGFSSYVRITAREMLRYAPAPYSVNGGASRPIFLITLANSAQFGNGVRIAPGARVDDGLLDLVVFEERSRLATILNVPRLMTGRVASAPGVSVARTSAAITVESAAPIVYHVDGEPQVGGTRLEAHVVPGALLVAART